LYLIKSRGNEFQVIDYRIEPREIHA
jgi:hypothetical protein